MVDADALWKLRTPLRYADSEEGAVKRCIAKALFLQSVRGSVVEPKVIPLTH
jgi:hypothetical protein